MALTFDPTNNRIILDSAYVSAAQMYSRWKEWVQTGDNAKYEQAYVTGETMGSWLIKRAYGGTTIKRQK